MSSHIASFIAAVWSLIRIGIIPGESSNSRSLPKRTHLLQENGNKETVNQRAHTNGFTIDSSLVPSLYILIKTIEEKRYHTSILG